ncbi:hypothetical protein FQN60_015571, partial [Etheostoma spectabile]
HFTKDSFVNWAQFNSGFSKRLLLKDGSVPTLSDQPGAFVSQLEDTGTTETRFQAVGCQTDYPQTISVGTQSVASKKMFSVRTQLSRGTLREHHMRSKGSQATVSCVSVGTKTTSRCDSPLSAPFKGQLVRPRKRPCLELEEEEEAVTSAEPVELLDSTCNQGHFVLTKDTDTSYYPQMDNGPAESFAAAKAEGNAQTLRLCGDMRADSPGHSAKYVSNTMMHLESNTILDLQLVQSIEVCGRYHMVEEGLKRCLDILESNALAVDYIVTDRHPQIQKFLRERNITQVYDVWHFVCPRNWAKWQKNRQCVVLRKWLRSIKHHLYWSANSSKTGPEKVAKWTSLVNHIQNVHKHENPIFPKCEHPDRVLRDPTKWFLPAYVDDLMRLVFEEVFEDPVPFAEEMNKISIPMTWYPNMKDL